MKCKTCGKYWDEKTPPPFEVSSKDGLVKCPDCMTTNKKERMIPLSVIDALIVDFKARQKYDPLEDPIRKYLAYVVIPMLEGLKK